MNNAEDALPQPQQIQDQPVVHTKWFTSLKSLKSRKLLALFVAVLTIAGISMWMTHWPEYSLPQTVPPADWKTYTSNTFPYTFKYPPTWKFEDNSQPEYNYYALSLLSPDLKETNDRYPNPISGAIITIDVYESMDKDLKDVYDTVTLYFYENQMEGISKSFKSFKVYSKQYTYLDGVKALRLDIGRGDTGAEPMVFGRGILVATVRNGKGYKFKFSQKDVNHTVVFDQILSTFKFTE
jgi:hypothetical protein